MRASLLVLGAAMALPGAAEAASVFVPYANLGVGYGSLSGNNVVLSQVPNSADIPVEAGSTGCCADGGLALDLRIGARFFGAIAIEGGVVGQGFGFGGTLGGVGFAGGGLRLSTLGLVELLTDPLELPIELTLGAMFGYAIVGKDFAYTGTALGLDATLEFEIVEFLSLGVRANLFNPSFDDFMYTDFNKNVGRCLNSSGLVPDPPGAIHNKGDEVCAGSGPKASFFSPQLVATFNIDVL